MNLAILAMPRSGSAWLASYLGYLHDPLRTFDWEEVRQYNIVDTGAAYNPGVVYHKYRKAGKEVAVLLRGSKDVYRSLHASGKFPEVTEAHVCGWLDGLSEVAERYSLTTVWAEDLLLGRYTAMHAEEFLDCIGEEFDRVRWANQKELNVQASLDLYTAEAFQRYRRWVDAP